jgi:hypothetical protein
LNLTLESLSQTSQSELEIEDLVAFSVLMIFFACYSSSAFWEELLVPEALP